MNDSYLCHQGQHDMCTGTRGIYGEPCNCPCHRRADAVPVNSIPMPQYQWIESRPAGSAPSEIDGPTAFIDGDYIMYNDDNGEGWKRTRMLHNIWRAVDPTGPPEMTVDDLRLHVVALCDIIEDLVLNLENAVPRGMYGRKKLREMVRNTRSRVLGNKP